VVLVGVLEDPLLDLPALGERAGAAIALDARAFERRQPVSDPGWVARYLPHLGGRSVDLDVLLHGGQLFASSFGFTPSDPPRVENDSPGAVQNRRSLLWVGSR
jgi:hypothetical protein